MDMASIREVFINAVAHNDWSVVEPAVYIFSNHIEVISMADYLMVKPKKCSSKE